MRILTLILFFVYIAFSCVKKPTTSPIPNIEFKDFKYTTKPTRPYPSDVGYIVIGYEDGDGDIFRNNDHALANLIIISYHKDSISGNFYQDSTRPAPTEPKIAISYATTVYQPGAGYKGKSVKGEIIIPYDQFRLNRAIKVIKHVIYVVDEAGNKSNVITSPIYTLTI